MRVLQESVRRQEPVGISGMTLLEIAVVFGSGSTRSEADAGAVLNELESSPAFRVFPLTIEVAREVAALGRHLGDPGDRAIVSTARVHNLRLVTSDQRIIQSGLVPVIE